MLLAGRFVVARSSLTALPDGPVVGVDLSQGGCVVLDLFPGGAEQTVALAGRVARWNQLPAAAGPRVRELRAQPGRCVVASERSGTGSHASLTAGAGARLGAALDAAALGLPPGPPALAPPGSGLLLGRPAIWPADPARPLERELAAAGELVEPVVVGGPVLVRERPAMPRLGASARVRVPRRVALVVGGLAACTGLLVSLLGGADPPAAHPVARRALPQAPVLRLPTPAPAPASRVRLPEPTARGGAARVLVRPPPPASHTPLAVTTVVVPVTAAAAPSPAARAAVPAHVPERAAGWVSGLIAGS